MWSFSYSRKLEDKTLSERVEQAFQALSERPDLGYLNPNLVKNSIDACDKNKEFFADKKSIVVIGLGGSSLGAKAITQALLPFADQQRIVFLDNVDSHTVDQWLDSVDDFSEWGWVVCSKSGGTLEVVALYDYCASAIKEKHNFSIVQSTAVVTETKDSPLYNFAKAKACPILPVPFDVGGRFSVFTPVGLFPLSFFEFDLSEFSKGYQKALSDKTTVINLVQQLWFSHRAQESLFYSFQYSDRLQCFGAWLQQLWSESLGKAINRQGQPCDPVATFVPCRGASDQHSVLQQIMEGPEKKLVCFHRVESSEQGLYKASSQLFENSLMDGKTLGELLSTQAEATRSAIEENHPGTLVLKGDELTPASMAHLMGLWMLAIGVMGELMDIDAFNQPGVESGKVITRRVLSQSR